MKNYIAYEKLSKKEKRKINQGKRKTWGGISPVTRKPTNSRAYNRKKNQCWKDELHSTDSFCYAVLILPFVTFEFAMYIIVFIRKIPFPCGPLLVMIA